MESAWPGTVVRELASPGFTARLLNVDWPKPNDCQFVIPQTSLVLTLTPLQPSRKVRLSSGGAFGDFTDAGLVVLMPGGVSQHCYGTGGTQSCLTLNIADDCMNAAGLAPQDWSPRMLQQCLDVRSNAVIRSLRLLSQEVQAPGFAADVLTESLGMYIAVELSRNLRRGAPETSRHGGMAGWQVKRIKDYVAAHLESSPSVTELASACGLSRRHLARAFKEATGETLITYITRMKFEEAERLLSRGDNPLKVVAAKLGYSSSSAFSTAFHRATGVSPSDYRSDYRIARLPSA